MQVTTRRISRTASAPAHNFAGMAETLVDTINERPHLPHGAVKVSVWLLGLARKMQKSTIEVYMKDILYGYDRDGIQQDGIAIRPMTLQDALEKLEEEGIIEVEQGESKSRSGHHTKKIKLLLN